MKEKTPIKIRQLYYQLAVFVMIFSLAILASLSWNIYKTEQQIKQSAEQSARISYDRDKALRHFLSKVGGVYLTRSKYSDGTSFLDNFPNQEIFDLESGSILTLYDPASLIKLMQQDSVETFEIPVRIIGTKPLNPENIPLPSEQNILSFLKTNTEFLEVIKVKNNQYLRLMKPLYTEQRCLKCHGQLGFKLGDMIGAVGVAVSMTPFIEDAEKFKQQLILTHLAIWLMGILGTSFYGRKSQINIHKELKLEAELQVYQTQLEHKVEQRTVELSKFSRALENSPVIVIITDTRGKVEYVNPRFTEITGYSAKEIMGSSTAIMKSTQTPASVYDNLWATISAGNIWTGELCNRRKNGRDFWVSASISPIFSHSGEKD